MKIEMTKCDHCGKLTEEEPYLIGVTDYDDQEPHINVGTIANRSQYDRVLETCGPACRLKLIAKLLDCEKTEHVA